MSEAARKLQEDVAQRQAEEQLSAAHHQRLAERKVPQAIAFDYDADIGQEVIRLEDGSVQYAHSQTNGVRGKGDPVLLHQGQGTPAIDARPAPKRRQSPPIESTPKPRQTVIFFDSNWLQRADLRANVDFFGKLMQRSPKIYTLPGSDPRIIANFAITENGNFETAKTFLAETGVLITEAPIDEVRGFFFLPLLSPEVRLTPEESSSLKIIAKKYGAILCGEHSEWAEYDQSLVDIFNPEFTIPDLASTNSFYLPTAHPLSGEETVQTAATAWAENVPDDRIVMRLTDGKAGVITLPTNL
jgi:hypothetical protein